MTEKFRGRLASRYLRSLLSGALLALPMTAMAVDVQVAAFTDTPDPVAAGGLVTYAARVDNNDTDAALDVVLRVSVPAGAILVSASSGCTYDSGASEVACDLGTVAGKGEDVRNISVQMRALGPGPATITATATVSSSNDTNAANNSQTQSTTVISGADLGLTKTGTPDPVVGGAQVTYTLTASNAGPNASHGIRIVDTLPPAATYVSASGSGWSCSHASRVVTCDRDAIHAVGAAIPALTVVARINAASGTVTNSATLSPVALGSNPVVPDPDLNNNTTTVDTQVLNGADLRMASKTVTTATPVIAGSAVGFRLAPRNDGPGVATTVLVTDTLPAGWTFVSASGPNWTCSHASGTISCSRPTLATGVSDDIDIVATAPGNAAVGGTGTDFTNTASLSSATADPSPGNNSASVTVKVMPDGADLSLTKTKSPSPVALGSTMSSTISLLNNGPRVATGPLRVIDQLAAGETYVSASGTGWSCTLAPGGTYLSCDYVGAPVAAGSSAPTLSIITRAGSAGALTNTVCTGSSLPGLAAGAGLAAQPPAEGDSNTSNDCASASATSTTLKPDLAITKTTSTPNGNKVLESNEAAVTYTLVVSNTSPAGTEPATGIRVADVVPAYLSGRSGALSYVVSPLGGTSARLSCTVAGNSLSCSQSAGELKGGESISIAITVPRPLREGSFTNTATVSNVTEGDPDSSNNSASDTVQIDPVADVQMTGKTVLPAAVPAGVNATYTLSFRNKGPSTAQAVAIADTFSFAAGDAGLSLVSIASSKSGSSCSIAAGAQITPAAPGFSCTIGSMADGETQTITLVVRPNYMAGNGVRSFGNAASVSTTTAESDPSNNTAAAPALVVNPAALDLLVNKTDRVDPLIFEAGATFIDYAVTVTNNGPSYGTGVRIQESFAVPAGKTARFVCDTTSYGGSTCNSPSLCSATGQVSAPGGTIAYSCQLPAGTLASGAALGDLASGQSKSVWLRFQVIDAPAGSGDVYVNTVAVEANEPDTLASNDSVTERTTARPRLDLSITKAASKATVSLREPFVWSLTISNSGPGDSLSTRVTDTLPAGMELAGAAPSYTTPLASGTCTVAGQLVSCDMGLLGATASATISIPVRITAYPAGGVANNTAVVGTDPAVIGGIDTVSSNDSATASVKVTRSSIAGTVFRDRDANGQPGGSGETGIAGVSLALSGTDAYGNPVNAVVTTAANGSYRFDNLPPSNAGGYTITETQPAAYVDGLNPSGGAFDSLGGTRPASGAAGYGTVIAAIPVGGADTGTGYNFAEVARPSIAGTVYRDLNNNGSLDGGETGIAGVSIQLLRATDNSLVAITTSGAGGSYLFSNLLPAAYHVRELQPAGFFDGKDRIGQVGGAACSSCSLGSQYDVANESATLDTILGIDLSNGDNATAMDFGELPPASLAGVVFVDFNVNGRQDAGEPGLPGVTLALSGLDDRGAAVNRTTTTDGSGRYSFTGLRPAGAAGYTLTETQPAGFADGPNPAAGSGADTAGGTRPASGAAGFGTVVQAIGLGAGVDATGYRFGEIGSSLLGGLIYHDRNRNGLLDLDDIGRLAGQTVQLVDPVSGTVIAITQTDASGAFLFTNAPVGNYRLVQLHPAGYGFSTPLQIDVSIPPAGLSNQLFGKTLSSIAGEVFLDLDHNGVRGPQDTAIPGSVIELLNAVGTVVATTTSDGNGAWRFDDLPAAGYTLRQPAQPAGTLQGLTSVGSAGGSSSLASAAVSATSGIALVVDTDATGYRFAEIPPARIAGSVYLDLDNNGLREAGETGFAGQTVTLVGANDLGAVSLTTTTDSSGAYAFAGLRPGSYTVTQPAQPAGTSNGITRAGSAGGAASAVATTPSSVANIPLAVGAQSVNNDFGELGNGSIAGAVYLDASNNGLRDAGEAGIAGQTIELTGTDSAGQSIRRSVVTGADGSFSFSGLLAGTYQLTQPAQPAATLNGVTLAGSAGGTATLVTTLPSTIGGVALAASANSVGNLFGEIPAAAIAGSVYNDADNNGIRGAGEDGYAGVRVTLTGRDDLGRAVSVDAYTDAAGRYRFPDLRPGRYTLTEPEQPPGTINGITSAGSVGGSASGVNSTPSVIDAIVLVAGAAGTDYNFGEIGNLPNLVVSKAAQGVFATNNLASYRILVGNIGQRATDASIRVEDRLPVGIVLAGTPQGSGWTCTGAANDSAFECSSAQIVAAGAQHGGPIEVPVRVQANAAAGANRAILNNAVLVSGGGEPEIYAASVADLAAFRGDVGKLPECTPAPSQNACRAPTTVVLAAGVTGNVWLDHGSQHSILDAGDRLLAGWNVEVVDVTGGTPVVVRHVTTAADGSWSAADLIPGRAYRIRFRDAASGVVWGVPVSNDEGGHRPACLAGTDSESCLESDEVHQLRIVLAPGQQLRGQSLPVDPSGVVYDSILRTPVPGSVVTLSAPNCAGFDPTRHIVNAAAGGYSIEGRAISMTVGPLGAYQFLLGLGAPASCDFQLNVRPPASHSFVSQVIPPQSGSLSAPAGVGAIRVQPQSGAPVDRESTAYWLAMRLGSSTHGVIHNHIPLDPRAVTGIVVSKIGSTQIVEVGDSLQYTVRVRNSTAAPFGAVFVEDRLPAGFRYIAGTAQLQRGSARSRLADPQGGPGPVLIFAAGTLGGNEEVVLSYRVRVGVGAQEGDGINRAQAKPTPVLNCAASPANCSNVAAYQVKVQGGVFTTDTCIAGKVFVDCNNNHVQDAEEIGIPGVRLWLQDGTSFTTDSEGKYSYCGLPPRLAVLKADPLTLPRGSRLTTSSNRNAGDANSLFLELKNGELHRADFIEGSCSNAVLEQVKARRAQGEVSAPQSEPKGSAPLRFSSKPLTAPQQATDSANQTVPKVRPLAPPPPTGDSERSTPMQQISKPAEPGGRDVR